MVQRRLRHLSKSAVAMAWITVNLPMRMKGARSKLIQIDTGTNGGEV